MSLRAAQLNLSYSAMGALQLALFIITYLRAVNALAQTPNELQRLSIRQELALQGDTTDEYQQQQHSDSLLAKVSTANADDSPYLDTAIENSIALPLSTVGTNIQPNLIVANNAHCLPVNHPTTGANPKTRSGRQRRDTTNSKLICPLPATTTTDSENHQPPIEEKGQQEVPTPHDGSPQSEPLNWPKLFKLPTKDGDNPACFEATNGLMPVGVCENPDGQPEPSRWDVFMQDNRDFSPRAWKLPNSQLGALFVFLLFFANLDLVGFFTHQKITV